MDPTNNTDASPNLSTHWEDIVNATAIDGKYPKSFITLIQPHTAVITINITTGVVIISKLINTSVTDINRVLKTNDIPLDGWKLQQ